MIRSVRQGNRFGAAAERVVSNDELAKTRRYQRRMDSRAHRHRPALYRRRGRDDRLAGDRSGAGGAGRCRASTIGEIDLIVLATATPDQTFPATATKVQHALGCKRRSGVRCRGRVLGLPLCAEHRRFDAAHRAWRSARW